MKKTILFLAGLLPLSLCSQEITTILPNNGNAGQTLNVVITGSNTNFAQASNSIIFLFSTSTGGYTSPNSITVNNNTSITVNITIPSNTYSGIYDVALYNSIDGLLEKQGAFSVNGLAPPLHHLHHTKPG